jgi:glycosyltransferase involved in cell wall biosynthesis
MSPRILVISEDLVAPFDEGIKKFAVSIARALEDDHPVRIVNVDRGGAAASGNGSHGAPTGTTPIHDVPGTRTFVHPALRREIVSFRPDVIIYVPSPSSTAWSFARSFALRRHWPRARLGMVALIPRRHGRALRPFLAGAAPDRIFVPSYASLLHACDLSLPGEILPVGVDNATFRPAKAGEKASLRGEFGIPDDAFVCLHVGHLRPKRNLGVLARLAAQPGAHVVVIGSTSTPADARVRTELEDTGVRVIRKFVPVDRFYRMADCYVFPTVDTEGCIEVPLSVLEALATGVPVVARPFGGLRDFLPPGEDVRYVDTDDELIDQVNALRMASPRVRDMNGFSWRRIGERIVMTLLEDRGEARA